MYVAHRLHCRRRCERSILLEFFMSDFARRVREPAPDIKGEETWEK